MGTKQLQADKRVAEVALNEAGKAATLTLAPGWTYEGSSGPFTLKNVEHGHQIVRGAVNPDAKAMRAPRAPRERKEGVDPTPTLPRPDAPPPRPREPIESSAIVFRTRMSSHRHNHEVVGWLRFDTDNPERVPKGSDLLARVREQLRPAIRVGSPDDYKPDAKRWTNRDQTNSRKNDEAGAPWGNVNYGD